MNQNAKIPDFTIDFQSTNFIYDSKTVIDYFVFLQSESLSNKGDVNSLDTSNNINTSYDKDLNEEKSDMFKFGPSSSSMGWTFSKLFVSAKLIEGIFKKYYATQISKEKTTEKGTTGKKIVSDPAVTQFVNWLNHNLKEKDKKFAGQFKVAPEMSEDSMGLITIAFGLTGGIAGLFLGRSLEDKMRKKHSFMTS